MLFKFSSSDVLNSGLLDASTGKLKYSIATRPHFVHVKTRYGTEMVPARRSFLLDSRGQKLASCGWTLGMQPTDIAIGREKLGGAKDLFGCMGPSSSPKVFGVSTRFDPDFYWLASPESLTLFDQNANRTRGQLHHSSVVVGSRIVHSPFLSGNDYLEYESHPRVSDEELIVTFILMEVLRRSRFANTPSQPRSSYHLFSSPFSKSRLVQTTGERLRRVGRGLTSRVAV